MQITGGWSQPRRSLQFVEVVFDKCGQGTLYLNGIFSDTFRLLAIRRWNTIQFRFANAKEPFAKIANFYLKTGRHNVPRYGGLYVGDSRQTLVLSDRMGDGIGLVFKRMSVLSLTNQDYTQRVSATLNQAGWYGKAIATKADPRRQTCPFGRFTLVFITTQPWNRSIRITNPELLTQHFAIPYIPLAVGYYRVAVLDTCTRYPSEKAEYLQLDGGDVVASKYYLLPDDRSWIQITKYDAATKVIEGLFNVILVDQNNKEMHFSNGFFRAILEE